MDAVCDMRIQKVVIMSAAQIGKTDALILNPIGYYMHYDPSPIMVMQPTIQMAETFSKDRLSPMLRDTPVLRDKVNDKSRNSGNTILQKIFPGGHVTMVGANSPSSLASRPIRILLADEIDRYPATAGNEGDPLLLAGKRLATFWNKKEVCVSTPTNKETSRIAVEFEHSTQEEWNVPCPACGAYTPLLWANIIFDRDKLDEIGCACPACGVVSSETEWKEQFGKGKFVAAHPERKVRGFHLNALASLFVEWREIVEKFLTANEEKKKGNIELLKVWTNTEMGETWEEEGEQIETDDLFKRRERYNCEVPEEVLVLTAGVDVQDDRFEVEVVGWGVDKESWGIKYQVIYGDLKLKPVWDELDKFLSQTFTTADGRRLKIICACVDSGGHFTTQVYRFCKERTARRVFAIKGKGGAEADYRSALHGIAGTADAFDALADHYNYRPVVGGLGNGDHVGGGRVLRGNGNGGFLRGWGLFLRLNLTFSAERGSHRIAVRLDIFAGIIEANLGTAGFAHILIRNGFRGPPGDLDGENALTVANATREVFLADFKLFHVITSHI